MSSGLVAVIKREDKHQTESLDSSPVNLLTCRSKTWLENNVRHQKPNRPEARNVIPSKPLWKVPVRLIYKLRQERNQLGPWTGNEKVLQDWVELISTGGSREADLLNECASLSKKN